MILFLSGFFLALLCCLFYIKVQKPINKEWQQLSTSISEQDIQILDRTLEILADESGWAPSSDRICIKNKGQSLFCAIAFASQEITGCYEHWGIIPQQVRKTVEDYFAHRWSEHPLMDFDTHPDTTHQEIIWLLEETRKRLINLSRD